jgi:hypothetical protein
MVLVIDPKPLEGRWWKFGAGLATAQLILWTLLGFKLNPDYDLLWALRVGYFVYGTFIVAAFLPFALGRIGLKRAMWGGAVGYIAAAIAYFLLGSFATVRQINALLPYAVFFQLCVTGLGIGLVVEFGRYVYLKLTE